MLHAKGLKELIGSMPIDPMITKTNPMQDNDCTEHEDRMKGLSTKKTSAAPIAFLRA